eukprot:259547-Prymnesium_polylepis.1
MSAVGFGPHTTVGSVEIDTLVWSAAAAQAEGRGAQQALARRVEHVPPGVGVRGAGGGWRGGSGGR